MLREYEFTFVTKTDSGDQDNKKVLEGYEAILGREGGVILKKNDWGTKRLAYPIKKSFKGHYVLYNVATVPANIEECERLLRIDDNVLRHLVIKTHDKVDVEKRKADLAKVDQVPQQER